MDPLGEDVIILSDEDEESITKSLTVGDVLDKPPELCIPIINKHITTDSKTKTVSNSESAEDLTIKFIKVFSQHMTNLEAKKVSEKLLKHFRKAETSYVTSKHYKCLITESIEEIENNSNRTFVTIKKIADDLKFNKKVVPCSSGKIKKEVSSTSSAGKKTCKEDVCASDDDPLPISPKTMKRMKNIEYLEKMLALLHKKIKQLQETEIDMSDDSDDSPYIAEERYEKKLMKVWNKLCELKGASNETGCFTEKKIKFVDTRYPEINRSVQKFLNRKKIFPDFCDILSVVTKSCHENKISLAKQEILNTAKEVFVSVGKMLKKRRILDFQTLQGCHLTDQVNWREVDPADDDLDLQEKLKQNVNTFQSKEEEIINEFTQKQSDVGEEPEIKEDEGTDDGHVSSVSNNVESDEESGTEGPSESNSITEIAIDTEEEKLMMANVETTYSDADASDDSDKASTSSSIVALPKVEIKIPVVEMKVPRISVVPLSSISVKEPKSLLKSTLVPIADTISLLPLKSLSSKTTIPIANIVKSFSGNVTLYPNNLPFTIRPIPAEKRKNGNPSQNANSDLSGRQNKKKKVDDDDDVILID